MLAKRTAAGDRNFHNFVQSGKKTSCGFARKRTPALRPPSLSERNTAFLAVPMPPLALLALLLPAASAVAVSRSEKQHAGLRVPPNYMLHTISNLQPDAFVRTSAVRHTVRAGDNLASIAADYYYQDSHMVDFLFQVNRQYADPSLRDPWNLQIGQTLIIPIPARTPCPSGYALPQAWSLDCERPASTESECTAPGAHHRAGRCIIPATCLGNMPCADWRQWHPESGAGSSTTAAPAAAAVVTTTGVPAATTTAAAATVTTGSPLSASSTAAPISTTAAPAATTTAPPPASATTGAASTTQVVATTTVQPVTTAVAGSTTAAVATTTATPAQGSSDGGGSATANQGAQVGGGGTAGK